MIIKARLLIICIAVIGLFSTCETEIDITGEYVRIPVVYGLLDQQADTQFVLINRTFLGVGNAFEMSLIEDSTLYDNVDAKIRWDNGTESVTLQEIRRCGKSMDGAFFSPCYQVWYVPSTELWDNWPNHNPSDYTDFTYNLDIVADGDVITASSPLTSVQGNSNNGGISQPQNETNLTLVSTFNPDGSVYQGNFRVVWNNSSSTRVRNAILQKVDVRFNYLEVMNSGEERNRNITFTHTSISATTPNATAVQDHAKIGDFLFRQIQNRLDVEDASEVRYRAIGDIEFILSAAGEDFSTYLDLGEPESEVGQERPIYSNINQGAGIGLFSSRDSYTRTTYLDTQGLEADLQEMVRGQFTSEFCFCDPTPGSTFDCADSGNQCQ
jgi:hypothetical protein